MSEDIELKILVEGDERLFNQYESSLSILKNDMINAEGAQAFIQWLLSDETQDLIKEFV